MLYNKAKYFPRSRPWENFRPQNVRASRGRHHRATAGDLGERAAIIDLPRGGMVGASYKRAKRARTRRGANTLAPTAESRRSRPTAAPLAALGQGKAARAARDRTAAAPLASSSGGGRSAGRGAASYTGVPSQQRRPPSSGATQRRRARRRRAARSESKGIRRVSRVRPERAAAGKPGSGLARLIAAARSGR